MSDLFTKFFVGTAAANSGLSNMVVQRRGWGLLPSLQFLGKGIVKTVWNLPNTLHCTLLSYNQHFKTRQIVNCYNSRQVGQEQ